MRPHLPLLCKVVMYGQTRRGLRATLIDPAAIRALTQPFSSLSCKSFARFALADFLAGSLFVNQPARDVPCT